jgi:hypothetical protein
MMGMMLRVPVCLLLAIVSLTGCGDDTAADGTTIVAPGNLTVTYTNSGGGPMGRRLRSSSRFPTRKGIQRQG